MSLQRKGLCELLAERNKVPVAKDASRSQPLPILPPLPFLPRSQPIRCDTLEEKDEGERGSQGGGVGPSEEAQATKDNKGQKEGLLDGKEGGSQCG